MQEKKLICSTRKIFPRHFPFPLKNPQRRQQREEKAFAVLFFCGIAKLTAHILLYIIQFLIIILLNLQRSCVFHLCCFVKDHMVHDPKM